MSLKKSILRFQNKTEIIPDFNREIYTKNMFIEAHNELGLSLFDKNLTTEIINFAYENILVEYITSIQNGINPFFDISDKKEARNYLLKFKGSNE